MSFFKARIKSFAYAFNGIFILFKTQPNAVIHLIATVGVLVLGFVYSISAIEWLFVLFSIALVLVSEAINSAIEFLGDAVTQEQNEWIKRSKDIGAGAVLIAACFATVAGLIIFIPKLLT